MNSARLLAIVGRGSQEVTYDVVPRNAMPMRRRGVQPVPAALADFDAYAADPVVWTRGRENARCGPGGRKIARVRPDGRFRSRPNWPGRLIATCPSCAPIDRFGNRVDRIDFHPAWHELMTLAIGQGPMRCLGPIRSPRRSGRPRRTFLLYGTKERTDLLPIGMTYFAVPILRHDRAHSREWGGQ